MDTTQPSTDKEFTVGKYKIKIVRSLCIGAASCVALSPAIFKLDDSNIAVNIDGGTDSPENVLMAAQSCPTKAIVVVDTETGQQVWPL
ncbi:MAG TPA: ferredoxin [Patescibacteria group bacterium]